MIDLKNLYKRCLHANYIRVENDGDYALERNGDELCIFFECTHGKTDWKNNFDFPAKPYSDMGIKWYCHRGFLRVWKSIKPYLAEAISDTSVKKITIVGYSHGAAIATLCHEYVWFNRPDLRENGLEGFGFGCPRCYWGFVVKKSLKERWEHFHPIRNLNDIVTHVPPRVFGFVHVNKVYKLKNTELKTKHVRMDSVNAHYPDNYLYSLSLETEDGFHAFNEKENKK